MLLPLGGPEKDSERKGLWPPLITLGPCGWLAGGTGLRFAPGPSKMRGKLPLFPTCGLAGAGGTIALGAGSLPT